MKKFMMTLAAAVLCSGTLFAMASDCPAEAKECKKECKKEVKAKPQLKGKKQMQRRPRFKISPEAKAEMEKFRAAVDAYKKDKSAENKAALTAILGKNFDKRLEMNAKRAEAMKKAAADLEKKTAEMKANRDAEIEKMLERIMNPPKRRAPGKRPAPRKAAPEKAAAPAPAAPAAK